MQSTIKTEGSTSWSDRVIEAAPGLPDMLQYFEFPPEHHLLFSSLRIVAVFAAVALVMASRTHIKHWTRRQTVRFVIFSTVGTLLGLTLFFTVYQTVMPKQHYGAEDNNPQPMFVPGALTLQPLALSFVYIDCTAHVDLTACDRTVRKTKGTAQEVADLYSLEGERVIIPHGLAFATWTAIMFALFTALVATPTFLFAGAVVKGIDGASFVKQYLVRALSRTPTSASDTDLQVKRPAG